jgi:hypothetical protein
MHVELTAAQQDLAKKLEIAAGELKAGGKEPISVKCSYLLS